MIKILGIILLAGITSCTTVKPANQAPLDIDSIHNPGEEIVIARRAMPNFRVKESNSMAGGIAAFFGPLGALAMISATPTMTQHEFDAGNSLIEQNKITDPAYAIAKSLALSMEEKYKVKYKGEGSAELASDEISTIAEVYKDYPLVMDIKTYNWAVIPSQSGGGNQVVYHALLRIIDTKNIKVIAEGICSSEPKEKDDIPTYNELIANNAIRMKSELDAATQFCIRELSSNVLGM